MRDLHPKFFQDDTLGGLSPVHALLFAGLWGLADKNGRLVDDPNRIATQLPNIVVWLGAPAGDYDPNDLRDGEAIDRLLVDLKRAGLIHRYDTRRVTGVAPSRHPVAYADRTHTIRRTYADGVAVRTQRALQITNWSRYQHPHPQEQASSLPPPPSTRKHVTSREVEQPAQQPAEQPAFDSSKATGLATDSATGRAPLDLLVPLVPLKKSGEAAALSRTRGNGDGPIAPPFKSSPPSGGRRLDPPEERADENLAVITKVVHEVLDVVGELDDDELRESTMNFCAQQGIAYKSAVVNTAVDVARAQRRARR